MMREFGELPCLAKNENSPNSHFAAQREKNETQNSPSPLSHLLSLFSDFAINVRGRETASLGRFCLRHAKCEFGEFSSVAKDLGGMTFDRRNYHPDWRWMSQQIKDQAGDCCEWCGVKNGDVGARDVDGKWHDAGSIADMSDAEAAGFWPTTWYPEKLIRIVLTVHHQCECDKTVCRDPSHLVCLCQRCHLNADRAHHLAVQAENRRAKRLRRQPELMAS